MGVNEQFTNFINQIRGNKHVEQTNRANLWEERKTRRSDGEDYHRDCETRGEAFREYRRNDESYEQTGSQVETIGETGSRFSYKSKTKISFNEARKKLSGSLNTEE